MRDRWIIQIDDGIRRIAMLLLYVFFFSYSIGNVVGIGEYYLVILYVAIVLAGILFFYDMSCLRPYRSFYIWIIGFNLLQGFSILYSSNGNKITMFISLFKILLKITAVTIICKDFQGIEKLLKGFAIIGGLVFATLYFTGNLFGAWRLGEDTVGNANSFAMNILVFAIGAGYFIFKSQAFFYKIFYGVMFGMDLTMLFLSGGRKFLLFLIIYIFLLYVFNTDNINILRTIAGLIFVGSIVYISYYLIMNVSVFYDAIGIRLIGLGTPDGALGTDVQFELMRRAMEAFFKRPLLGWGIGGFQHYDYIYYGRAFYSHSNYTEILANFGLVGFVMYYRKHISAFHILILPSYESDGYNRNTARKLLFPLLCGILAIDLFSITFNQTAYVPMFMMWISGYVYEEYTNCSGVFDSYDNMDFY